MQATRIAWFRVVEGPKVRSLHFRGPSRVRRVRVDGDAKLMRQPGPTCLNSADRQLGRGIGLGAGLQGPPNSANAEGIAAVEVVPLGIRNQVWLRRKKTGPRARATT